MTAASNTHRESIPLAAWALTFLALSAALTAASGLLSLVRGLDAGLVIPTILAGFLAGWLLARPNRGLGWPLFLIAAGGILFQFVFAGQLTEKLWALFLAWTRIPVDLPAWVHGSFAGWEPVRSAWVDLGRAVDVDAVRITHWAASVRQGKAVFDPLIPSLSWGWVLWIVSGWTGCALRRRYSAIAILLPAIALLAGGYGIVRGDPIPLVILLGILLAMSVLSAQLRREQGWDAQGLDYTTEIRFDLELYAVPLFVLVMGAAVLIPSIPWENLFKPASPVQTSPSSADSVFRSFGLQLPTRVPTVLDNYWSPGLPRRHLIGSGPELSQRVAMLVHRLGAGSSAQGESVRGSPYYWRAFTYDRYIGSGWMTSPITALQYPAYARLPGSASNQKNTVKFEVQESKNLGGVLYYSSSLVAVDQSVTVQSRSPEDPFAGYLAQADYLVEISPPAPDPAALRQAGESYPDWVKRSYLQLPEALPNRVISLARGLTATASNPYDRAKSIESYLHTLPYTLDLPAPPADRDVVDYFLFDLKKGYCDDFASAMVVLARVAGIPARLVVGYAPGQYDPVRQVSTVTEANAHSWPELYFPGYGWVEFEPTPGIGVAAPQSSFVPAIPSPPAGASGSSGISGTSRTWQIPWTAAILALVVAGIGLLAFFLLRDRRLQRLSPRAGLEWIYRRLWPSDPMPIPGLTPLELAALLTGRMSTLTGRRWIGRLFAPAAGEIASLIGLYSREAYSTIRVTPAEYAAEVSRWRKLRLRLWLADRVAALTRLRPSS